ncbi:MAG: preprotein translocase subunit SecE [Ruminococcus sp.]|nr:preprotein translocase subunit SecE [Ruminococcus sp.]
MADIEKKAAQPTSESKAEKKAKSKADSDSKKSKSKKSDKDKQSIFKRIANWFKDLRKEFKKVTWPDKKSVFKNTLVVLCVVVIGSIFVGLLDFGFLKLMEFLMGLSK